MMTYSRKEAIDRLRDLLGKLTDADHSICEVAAQKGIFCQGFSQFTDQELFKQYKWMVKRLNIRNRQQLEEYANIWQLTQEVASGMPMACDVQCEIHDTCKGWDTFDNQTLERFLFELSGEKVEVGNIGDSAVSPMTL